MKVLISTKFFPKLQKLDRKKGENRLKFFCRQFKGMFTKAQQNELQTFIIANGFRPMEPIWPNQGCYILAAADTFEKHPMRDKYLSALMIADMVWAYPGLEVELLRKIKLVLGQRAQRYGRNSNLSILLRQFKQKETKREKQVRLLARNFRQRNSARVQGSKKPKNARSRNSDNEGA
jgi:hypothetical protein